RREAENAGRDLGVNVFFVPVSGPEEFDAALTHAKHEGAVGIIVPADPVTLPERQRLVRLALHHHLPGIYLQPDYVQARGLMSYSINPTEHMRRAARYVDKLLRGAKPSDLPIEQPAKLELVINLQTAKALGLTIPSSLLLRANQLIE